MYVCPNHYYHPHPRVSNIKSLLPFLGPCLELSSLDFLYLLVHRFLPCGLHIKCCRHFLTLIHLRASLLLGLFK